MTSKLNKKFRACLLLPGIAFSVFFSAVPGEAMDNAFFNLKPWYRIPEDEKSDDNPDIHNYLGYGELTGAYKWGNHTFSILLRNNLRIHENKGAAQVDWSFPFREKLRWYFQYFTGYGESLIDYNASSDSFGVGIQLTDWF